MIKNTASELKLSFRQSLNALKQEIENKITLRIIDEPVSEVFSDNSFLAGLIEIIAEKWAQEKSDQEFEILLPEKAIADVEKYLKGKTNKVLSAKLSLRPGNHLKKDLRSIRRGSSIK
jgi:transcriptional/translational regulatory protein YebC/TACO1